MAPDKPADARRSNLKFLVFVILAVVVLLFCANDLIGLHNDSGLLSIAADIKAVDAESPEVDVDRACLRTVFLAICAFVVGGIGALANADVAKRGSQMIFILSIIGGGFAADAIFGPTIVEHYMEEHGYVRCIARDHADGIGKGRVWFDSYVSDVRNCAGTSSTR
jgi:hypothetical protein